MKLSSVLSLAAVMGFACALPAPNETAVFSPDVSAWDFSCYNGACIGNVGTSGDTRGGGTSLPSKVGMVMAGCTQYSYVGSGTWKICIYDAPPDPNDSSECTGDLLTSVNGGTVTCLAIGVPNQGCYKIIAADGDCP